MALKTVTGETNCPMLIDYPAIAIDSVDLLSIFIVYAFNKLCFLIDF